MRENEKELGITSTTLQTLVKKSDIILLAVRPHQAEGVLSEMARIGVDPSKMVVSVLAGVQLAYYQKYFTSQLLRLLPNLASAVGEGMSIFTYGPSPSVEFRSLTNLLFSCMGEIIEVPENLMDISCGISGSGPAFVIRLIAAMASAGEKGGLSHEKALKMAAQTFSGAAKLILKGKDPSILLSQIAVPNGTTEAGLRVMSDHHMDEHFRSVVDAAAKRSKELSEEFS